MSIRTIVKSIYIDDLIDYNIEELRLVLVSTENDQRPLVVELVKNFEVDFQTFSVQLHDRDNQLVGESEPVHIDVEMESCFITVPIKLRIPTFSVPHCHMSVSTLRSSFVVYYPLTIAVEPVRPHIFPPQVEEFSEKYLIELKLVSRSKETIASAKSVELHPELIMTSLVVRPSDQLHIETWEILFDSKIECYLIDATSNEKQLIDIMKFNSLREDDIRMFGNSGYIQLTKNRPRGKVSLPLLLGQKSVLNAIYPIRVRVTVKGLPPSLVNGILTWTLVGYGYDPICRLDDIQQVLIPNDSCVFVNIDLMKGDESVPILGIIARDSDGILSGMYSVPLVHNAEQYFHTDPVSVQIEIENVGDENDSNIVVLPKNPSIHYIAEGMTRVVCTIESAKRLPETYTSVMVCCRTVSLNMCPVLLSSSEILSLQPENRFFSSSSTVTRNNTAHPVWHQDLTLDVDGISHRDWLYFMIYETEPETVLIGHCCVPLGRSVMDSGQMRIPVINPHSRTIIPSAVFIVSFPQDPIKWSPICIIQPKPQYIPHEGEIALTVEVFHDEASSHCIKSNHIWLPIKDHYPLIIPECPPAGYLTMRLSQLNGKIIAETSYKFTLRENDSFSCGGIRFFFSRNSYR
jgi:hypothetical protein